MKAWLAAIYSALLVLVLAGAVLFGIFYTQHAVSADDHRWCSTLQLLTAHAVPKPTDPKANPSREAGYVLYSDFVKLRDEFQCPR